MEFQVIHKSIILRLNSRCCVQREIARTTVTATWIYSPRVRLLTVFTPETV